MYFKILTAVFLCSFSFYGTGDVLSEINQETIESAPNGYIGNTQALQPRIDGTGQDLRLAVSIHRERVFDLPASLKAVSSGVDSDRDGVVDEYDPHPNRAGLLRNIIYEVPYNGKVYVFRLNIQTDYLDIYRLHLPHELKETGDNVRDFVLVGDPYVKELADQAKNYASQDKKVNARDLLLSLVKNIPYNQDGYTGKLEYPKYAVETLVDRSGDCEDFSILAVNLLGELEGYDKVAFIFFPGHMGVGIKTDKSGISALKARRLPSDHIISGQNMYLYQEATSPGWRLGQIPVEYDRKKAVVYPIL